jgi:hypothetical protein
MSHLSTRLLIVILIVAGSLRFVGLDVTPPGLTTDEGLNGVFAQQVLAGERPIFFEPDSREPLYPYMAAVSVALLGPTPMALRVPVALVGTLLVLVTFLLARLLFGAPAGLLAAAAIAVGYWPLQLSREGFRALTTPLVEGLALYFLYRGLKRGSAVSFGLAGIFLGGCAYTYPAGRMAPVLVGLLVAGMLLADRPSVTRSWRGLLLTAAAAAITFAPLGLYFLANPSSFGGRMLSASTTGSLDPGSLLAALQANLLPTLGMFSFVGDAQWKYNLSGQPVFGPVWSVLFYAGLLLCVARLRQPPYLLLLLWLATGLLPGALSGESPHFMRTVGAMPATYILPAIALVAAGERLRSRISARALVATAVIFISCSGALTAWRYFAVWASAPQVSYYFYEDMSAASRFLNSREGGERVVLSAEYYDLHHTMMSYLTSPRPRDVKWIDARRAIVYPARAPGGALYVFPASAAPTGGSAERLLPGARLVAEVAGSSGAPLLQAFAVGLPKMPEPSRRLDVNLGGVAQVLGYDLEPGVLTPGQPMTLRIYWRVLRVSPLPASQSYTFFAHLVDDGGYLWSQDDGAGFRTPEWEVGDGVVTTAVLTVPPDAPPRAYRIRLGMYSPAEPQPLSVLDARGAPAGTEIETDALALDRRGATGTPTQPLRTLPDAQWGGLRLSGYALSRESLGPGETLRVTLHWAASAAPEADRQLSLELTDTAGSVRAAWHGPLVAGYPATGWPAGASIRNWYDLAIPAETPTGSYNLRLSLDPAGGPTADLGVVAVAGRPRSFTPPDIQHALRLRVSNFGDLLGYALDRDSARAGQALQLTLYWRALTTPPVAYKVFVHLLDAKSVIWGQRDAEPQNGGAPTTSWVPGEIVSDSYSIPVQPNAPPGEYDIEIGMYSLPSGARLPVTGEAGQSIGDHVILGRVAVVQ